VSLTVKASRAELYRAADRLSKLPDPTEHPSWVAAWWKPIESAPKDGRFLIGGPTITGRAPPWRVEIASYRNANGIPIMVDDAFEASHWMPLPPPPQL
jgi:hypothetical protein